MDVALSFSPNRRRAIKPSVYSHVSNPHDSQHMCNKCLNLLFDDKRLIVAVLMLWLAIVCAGFYHIGLLNTSYMAFGPSSTTVFMNVTLDTWYKWSLVAIFTVINTAVNDFSGDALGPWMINVITDIKTRYIPYSKVTCVIITQMYTIYGVMMSIFTIHLILSQVDFVFIRLLTDIAVSFWTQLRYLRNKEFNPGKYKEVEMHVLDQDETSASLCREGPLPGDDAHCVNFTNLQ